MIVAEASITGAVKMILMIIGVLVVLRFVGQLMNAKKNMEEERELNRRQRALEEEARKKKKYFGRTRVLDKNSKNSGNVEDVHYEEVD